jgi:hypothetical protein
MIGMTTTIKGIVKPMSGAVLVFAAALGLAPELAAQNGPYQFHALTPCRIVDTRKPVGPTGGPVLQSEVVRSFPIRTNCGVPVTANAVALNVTVTQPTNFGHLTLFPSGSAVPVVSTLNWNPGEPALANGAIVPLSTNANDLSLRPFLLSNGTVHVILDVTGYFDD